MNTTHDDTSIFPTNLLQSLCSVETARGFVAFGAGVYRLQQCSDASLVIAFRRPGEEGYAVGDRAAEIDTTPIPASEIIAKLQFTSAAGLDSLERHLREIRQEHWPATVSKAPAQRAAAMSNEHRALKLADQLSDMGRTFKTPSHNRGVTNGAIQTIRAQHALIVQMFGSLLECMPWMDTSHSHAAEANDRATAVVAAANDYLKD